MEETKLVICPYQCQCLNDDCPHFHPHKPLNTCSEECCEEYGRVGRCVEVKSA